MNGEGTGCGRATVKSSVVIGCKAVPVDVEAAVEPGVGSTRIVGLPDADALEARERVRCAVRAAGFSWPRARVLVNLAPSSVKKRRTGLDLAIAVAVLAATGQVAPSAVAGRSFVGELALDGRVRPVRGMYCHALAAARAGLGLVCAPGAGESALAGAPAYGLPGLAGLGSGGIPQIAEGEPCRAPSAPDLADVPGLAAAKRAVQVAAAGGHGLLMVGPPGSCASMLAARIISLMPPMGDAERSEAAAAWSAAGEDPSAVLAGGRPFRAPHHSATAAGLVGGGRPVVPGEVSLAHGGVLYLERIEEFSSAVLQQLRAPAENGGVRVVRAEGSVEMPARFMLVASAWPCPCGRFGAPGQACTCTEGQIRAFQARTCGPLLDRFAVRADLSSALVANEFGTAGSDLYRDAVWSAWERRAWREERGKAPCGARGLLESCSLSDSDGRWFEKAAAAAGLSGREIASVLGVARTIADMDGRDAVRSDDLAGAISLRVR